MYFLFMRRLLRNSRIFKVHNIIHRFLAEYFGQLSIFIGLNFWLFLYTYKTVLIGQKFVKISELVVGFYEEDTLRLLHSDNLGNLRN